MATTTGVFNAFKLNSMNGLNYDLSANTLKVCLTKGTGATWTPAAHQGDTTPVFSDIGADECSGTGYSSGGLALTHTPTWTQDNTNNRAALTVGSTYNLLFSAVTLTAQRYLVLYNSSKSNALICWADFGSDVSPVGQDLSIDWGTANGVLAVVLMLT